MGCECKRPRKFCWGKWAVWAPPEHKTSFLRSETLSDGRKRTVGAGRIGIVLTKQKEGALVLPWQKN